MKITALEVFQISVPLVAPYRLSKCLGTVTDAQAVILRLETDSGHSGYGEADPLSPFTKEDPASIKAALKGPIARILLGAEAQEIPPLEAALAEACPTDLLARGAVNVALFDLNGRARGLPIHKLLGSQHHSRIPLFSAIGCGTPAQDHEKIAELVRQGYQGVMIKMGADPISIEIERMVAAHRSFHDKIAIITDANQGWSEAETGEFFDGIGACLPAILEQPVPRGDAAAMHRIRKRAGCLISADESVASLEDARELIGQEAVDVFSIKVSKNGGLNQAMAVADLARRHGIGCLMNSMIEFGISQAASLHLAATFPHLTKTGHAYGSVLRLRDDITDFGSFIQGVTAVVPEGPGLGIALDRDKLQHYAIESFRVV